MISIKDELGEADTFVDSEVILFLGGGMTVHN